MKRGMLAALCLVLLTSVTWGADWYRYEGTISGNLRYVTGEPELGKNVLYVLVCYDTTPWGISFENYGGTVFFSGEFDQEGRKLQFRASEPPEIYTVVGRGSFNVTYTTLGIHAWVFRRYPSSRSAFGQYHFWGKFLDVVVRP